MRGIQNVAGNDDIGTAKEHHRVSVRVRRRLMQDFNALTVEVHVLSRLLKSFGWNGGSGKWRDLARRRAHSSQYFFERQNRRAEAEEVRTHTGSSTLQEQRLPCFRDRLVSPNMIGIGAGIDHIPNGPCRNFLDRGQHGVASRCGTRVNDHDTIVAHLDADVGARSGNHVEVRT